MMRTSDRGIVALLSHEGVVPGPYYDSVGVLTYGVGHTKAAGNPNPAKMVAGMPDDLDAELVRVFEVFRKDLTKYEADVRRAITVDITQAQFDAAVSFHYNTGAIHKASWVKKLNAGDVIGAGAAIMNWKKPPEIIPRRQDEQRLFRSGVYPPSHITVWKVGKDRRVIWQKARTLSPSEALGLMRGPITHDDPQTAPAPRISPQQGIAAAIGAAVVGVYAKWAEIVAWFTQLIGG